MSRPRLLDLFCGAGGCSVGYKQAGFDVVGIDIETQKNYPFTYNRGDALVAAEWLARSNGVRFGRDRLSLDDFDVVHASPPCQSYTPLGALHPHKSYPDLVAATRDILDQLGKPYVIENVMSAPLDKARSVVLCGGMFGLRTYRHRRFESRVTLAQPVHPKHVVRTATKRRRERWDQGWHVSITGDVGTYLGPEAMGIDWMNGNELSQAIPPAYTKFIGGQLIEYLEVAA